MQSQNGSQLADKPTPQKRSKRPALKKTLIITASVIGSILLLAVGVFFFFLSKINFASLDKFKLASAVPTDEKNASPGQNTNPGTMQWATGGILSNTKIQNILIIGCDTRASEEGYGRSDSMILLSIDKNNKRIILTSFLRDLYVKINGLDDNRINVSYAYGGPKLLIDTIQNNFRIKVDNYVRIDYESFKDIINTIGGVSITLTSAEANELGKPGQYVEYGAIQKVKAGPNLLDGNTALAYSRIRHTDNDFTRSGRQRNVIGAIIAKLKTTNIATLLSVANKFLPAIQTDLSYGQISGLVFESGTLMNYPVSQLTVPVAGGYYNAVVRNMDVLVPDIEKNKMAIWALIYNQ
jgi:LCP family protein required for cell wall assembly